MLPPDAITNAPDPSARGEISADASAIGAARASTQPADASEADRHEHVSGSGTAAMSTTSPALLLLPKSET